MLVIQNNLLFRSIILPFIILVLLELILKGVALYKAGHRGEIGRFICLFIFNTCGILPIIYLLIVNGKEKEVEKKVEKGVEKKVKSEIELPIKKDLIKDVKNTKNNDIKAEKKKVTNVVQTKKTIKKGGVKVGENVMSTKKQKGASNATGKKSQKEQPKEK